MSLLSSAELADSSELQTLHFANEAISLCWTFILDQATAVWSAENQLYLINMMMKQTRTGIVLGAVPFIKLKGPLLIWCFSRAMTVEVYARLQDIEDTRQSFFVLHYWFETDVTETEFEVYTEK